MPPVEGFLVAHAVAALIDFCVKHNAEPPNVFSLVLITIALHIRGSYEWRPTVKAFRAILIVEKTVNQTNVALVHGYEGVDEPLTRELGEAISKATNGRW